MTGGRADAGRLRTDILKLAVRFADLWAVDPHQMADEIYAPSIHMESMAGPTVIDGIGMLHELEDRLAALIPGHRHELVRVLVAPPAAFLETTVVGPATGEYAQASLWWLVGDPAGPRITQPGRRRDRVVPVGPPQHRFGSQPGDRPARRPPMPGWRRLV